MEMGNKNNVNAENNLWKRAHGIFTYHTHTRINSHHQNRGLN